jgi:hypothetical protein
MMPRWAAGRLAIRLGQLCSADLNALRTAQESGPVSYMREALALRLMNDIGVPSQRARYVRLFQNGACVGSVCELLLR